MNAERRKRLEKANDELRAISLMIEETKEEENEAWENMPESLQDAERGETMQENFAELEEIYGELDGLIERLETLCE